MKTQNIDKLRLLLQDEGFSEVLKALGEEGSKEEKVIRKSYDTTLSSALEVCFCLMMECYPRATKKTQHFIKRTVSAPILQDAIELLNWKSENHYDAMKTAMKKLEEIQ